MIVRFTHLLADGREVDVEGHYWQGTEEYGAIPIEYELDRVLYDEVEVELDREDRSDIYIALTREGRRQWREAEQWYLAERADNEWREDW